MRVIKVVPSFINRDFSMPATSFLRPGSAQKRMRESDEEGSNKRSRLHEEQRELMDMDPARDQPLLSTESPHSYDDDRFAKARPLRDGEHPRRSKSGSPFVFIQDSQTGQDEFTTRAREESIELGDPSLRSAQTNSTQPFKKPLLPASKISTVNLRNTHSPTESRCRSSSEDQRQHFIESETTDRASAGHRLSRNNYAHNARQLSLPHEDDWDSAVLHESPRSTPAASETAGSQVHPTKQRPLVSPSPAPFINQQAKPLNTYGRSPKVANQVQRDVSLLNNSRRRLSGEDSAKSTSSAGAIDATTVDTNAREGVPSTTDSKTNRRPGALKKVKRPALINAHRNSWPDEIEFTSQEDTVSRLHMQDKPSTRAIFPTRSPASTDRRAEAPTGKQAPVRTKKNIKDTERESTPKSAAGESPIQEFQNTVQKAQTNGLKRGPRRSEVPLPENIRNLSSADLEALKVKAGPLKKSEDPSTGKKPRGRPPKKPKDPPLVKRPRGRPRKNPLPVDLSEPEKQPTPRPAKREAAKTMETKPVHMGNTKDPYILSSGGSSSDDSELERFAENPRGAQRTRQETPSLAADPPTQEVHMSSTEKKHNGIMNKMFPGGHEKVRQENDPAHLAFGDVTGSPSLQEPEQYSAAEDKPDLVQKEGGEEIKAPQRHRRPSQKAAMDGAIETSEPAPSTSETREDSNNKSHPQKAVAPGTAPWSSESWGFSGANQVDTQEESAAKLSTNPQPDLDSEGSSEPEPEPAPESEVDVSKSRSASAANSARSSPAVSRRPARFLSHSPTPEKSNSEDESAVSRSRSRSQAASLQAASDNEVSESEDSSSGNSSSGSGSEDDSADENGEENEDVEMANAEPVAVRPAASEPPSSPPDVPRILASVIPATQSSQLGKSSQPHSIHRTPVPLPSNIRRTTTPLRTVPRPSIPLSQRMTARRTTQSKFPSLSQQLQTAQSPALPASQTKKFDPKTSNFSKLVKSKGKATLHFSSDSEEDSSDSSSDDSDGQVKGQFCSVA